MASLTTTPRPIRDSDGQSTQNFGQKAFKQRIVAQPIINGKPYSSGGTEIRLKRQYADVVEEKSEPATVAGAAESAGNCDHRWQYDAADQEHEGTSAANHNPTWSHGIREIAQSLIQAVDEDSEEDSETQNLSGSLGTAAIALV
ncbi:hypothetical protein L210DRAFT_3652928 [Boletus edulis BED1]|uniref:Uncharacterized protein n=1 Tax=Boletus edulis BED1 TaxID=1328754 RepID=A0AAD4G7H3_BOLED|nr:hypothetical protein L210DRAFT_3652928 [Boletus edulis BED1]